MIPDSISVLSARFSADTPRESFSCLQTTIAQLRELKLVSLEPPVSEDMSSKIFMSVNKLAN
jgi:hypothetical protein